ncbi:uncharacterized protein [Euphorbia lathyris]|uniref:uncharacterized protein n=1 Tax=Euphorbia lathyris TaxID=212925 RepID=UPI0033132E6B
MGDEDKVWLNLPKYSEGYMNGVKAFIANVFSSFAVGNESRCPCKKCKNCQWHCKNAIYDHLICKGHSPMYTQWIYDVSCPNLKGNNDELDCENDVGFGDDLDKMLYDTYQHRESNEETNEDGLKKGPNVDARKFYRLVEEGKQPLYPGCKKFSRLSFIVRLYLLKCIHGITESAFGDLLELIKEAFPDVNIPTSFNDAKNIIKDLGLDYQKIHACPNDCMLYWAENESEDACKTCGSSRWKVVENKGVGVDNKCPEKIHKVPAKVMRYFPLKPRLQRLFMCKEFSQLMIWHAVERKNDGKLRHPADGEAWKKMDAKYPQFSSEIRNVRLGLDSDGFNPFRTMSVTHSTWPIVLVNYNLPPWLSMKPENLILSTLISGPNSPGNNIDVYMQPLIAELKDLWDVGLETYDAFTDRTFMLHACVLWTISDFPGYAMLSGWNTKGKLACPVCNYETCSFYLKHSRKMCYMDHRRFLDCTHQWRLDKRRFNGKTEMRESPTMLTGTDIEELLGKYVNEFGKQSRKQKSNYDSPFKKKSIFFYLPYWSHNLARHNLDVMQ